MRDFSGPRVEPPTRPDAGLDHRAAVRAEYDRRAPGYENPMHRALAGAVAEFCDIDRAAGRRDDVVDVATGTGLVLRSLARRRSVRGRSLRAVGIDIAPKMLAVARRESSAVKNLRATYVLADATAVPLPDGATDLVTCVTALHLLSDTGEALREWSRLLRPDGAVVTATFAGFGAPGRPRPFRTRHEELRTPEQIADAARPAGLRLVRHDLVALPGDDVALLAELAPA